MGSRLGSAQSSTTGTLAFGSIGAGLGNRALCVCVDQEVSSPTQLVVNYGDATMQHVVGINVGDSTDNRVDLYYLNDAGIAGATGTTITAVSAPTSTAIVAQVYQEVMQTTPTVVDSEALTGDSDPLTNIQISGLLDGVTFGGGGTGNASGGTPTYAGSNPLSHLATADASSSCCTAGDRISGGTETVNHNITYVTAPNRVTGAAFFMTDNPSEGIASIDPTTFDMDNSNVDINGSNFNASQTTGTVYLSDADTLAGSANEVDISSAVNTWADGLINLDLTQLSAGELADLHTLGPGQRYVIVLTSTPDEYGSAAITLHRPHAIEMVLSSEFAPSGTSQRLTGLSGTFGGGRIEEALNPSTTDTNVADDGNREDVWNIQATTQAREVTYNFRTLYGGLVADTITQTPQLTVSGAITANGAPSITLPTSAGTAEIINDATGSPSAILPTSSGTAKIIKKAAGAAVVVLITAAGVAECTKTADGAPSVFLPTASGTAEVIKTSSGSPDIAIPTSSGVAEVKNDANGAPEIVLPTAAGVATIIKTASGAPEIILPTSDGTANADAGIGHTATGAPSTFLPTSSGVAEVVKTASGNPNIALPVVSGVAERIITASGGGASGVSFAQADSDSSFSAVCSPSLTSVTAGNMLVCFIGMEGDDADTLTVEDDNGNSWTIVGRTLNANTDGSPDYTLEAAMAYVLSANAGTTNLTVTHATGSYIAAHVREFSTLSAGFSYVDSAGGYDNSTVADSGPVTGSGELAVGGTADWSTGTSMTSPEIPDTTAASGEITTWSKDISAYRIAPLTNPEFTSDESGTQEWVSVVALFDEAPSGGVLVPLPTASGNAKFEHTAAGGPSAFLPTSSGAAKIIKTATGGPSAFLPTSAGAAFIWPRVYLNTTQTLIGATEMTVTAANAAGTSITFDDPLGAPTGSLWLGVENQINGDVGWIAVTVTTSGADQTANGAPSVFLPTSSGAAQVIKTATGGPSAFLPTASGVAETINTATGGPSAFLPTSSGVAEIIKTADGAPSTLLPTSAGGASVEGLINANGAPSTFLPVSAGTAGIERSADGAPSTFLPVAAGVAEVINPAVGAPSTYLPTSSGVAKVIKTADGAPSTLLPTSSSAAEIIKTAAGGPSAFLPTAAGEAKITSTATGGPSAFLPTSAGVAKIIKTANGAPSTFLPTSSGSANGEKSASGAPSTFLPVSEGVASVEGIVNANGAPSVFLPISSGVANLDRSATGAPNTILPTSAGVARVIRVADGGPSAFLPTSTGVAEVIKTADGSPSTFLPTSAGVAEKINVANGAPSTILPTSAGEAITSSNILANGAPEIILPTSAGVAKVIKTATGGPSALLPTSSGLATITRFASGAPSTVVPIAAGVAETINTASGAPSAILPTSTGVARVFQAANGAPSTFLPIAAGVAEVIKTADGGPSAFLPAATGIAKTIKTAVGSPNIILPVAAGIASKRGFVVATGSPDIVMPIASGVAIHSIYGISDYVTEIRALQSRFADNWIETPIQWGNIAIQTSGLTEWVRFVNDSQSSIQKSLGSDPDVYRYFGKVTVEINVKPNSGANRALQLADLVTEIWRSALLTDISMDVPKLIIDGVREGWYRVNVVCPYFRDSYQIRSV